MAKATPLPAVIQARSCTKRALQDEEEILYSIYLRVSSGRQVTHGFGLPSQLEICETYGQRFPNWRHFKTYTDQGISGTVTERDELNKLIEDAKKHNVRFILVAYLNRQSRTEYVGYYLDRRLAEAGITLVSATQDFNPYEINQVARGLQRVMDSSDREQIIAQTNNGRQKAAEDGYWTGGPAPYGYRIVGKGLKRSTLAIHKGEKKCLLRMVELVVDEGFNLSQTADQLNLEGFRNRRGGLWTHSNVGGRLRSESAAGTSTFRKTNSGTGTKRQAVTRVDADGNPLLGAQVKRKLPTIISPARHALLTDALGRIGYGRNPEHQYLLSTYIKGGCGGHYTATNTHAGFRYRCSNSCTKTNGCTDVQLRMEEIDEAVWGALRDFFKDRGKLKALAKEWRAMLPNDRLRHQQNAEALTLEVEKGRRVLEGLAAQLAAPDLDEDEKEVLQGSKVSLLKIWKMKKAALAQAREALEKYDVVNSEVLRIERLVNDARVRLDDMTFAEKRTLLRLLDIEVRVIGKPRSVPGGLKSPVDLWHRDNNVLIPSDPSDDLWEEVLSLMYELNPGLHHRRIPPENVQRQLRSIFYRLRTGCRWKEIPRELLGTYTSHAVAFAQAHWWENGTWKALIDFLPAEGGTPIATPTARPPLEITGRLSADVLERTSISLHTGELDFQALCGDSKIFCFSLAVI